MNIIKRVTLLILSLAMVLGLAACGPSGPDMPMEADVDGRTITLGSTTMQDLVSWGYEVSSAGRQDVAHEGDKYIYFMYMLSKGAGYTFWANVYTPYYGGTNINKEAAEAAESGVVYSVTLRKSAAEKMSVSYNGMDIQDITFDTAKEWGAKQDEDASKMTWRLTAAKGSLAFTAEDSFSEEMHSLQVSMNSKTFADMQK